MRQSNYIVNAFLLVLLLFFGVQIFQTLSESTSRSDKTEVLIDQEKPEMANHPGKILFQSKCASCHHVFRNMTGPALAGFEERGPWGDKKKLYAWIRNPSAFMETDAYTRDLRKNFGSTMSTFPDLTDEQINLIVEYIQLQSTSTL